MGEPEDQDDGLGKEFEAEFWSHFGDALGPNSDLEDPAIHHVSRPGKLKDNKLIQMLESLSSEGSPDESGVFTLNPQEARKKLQEFSLRDAKEAVVHLVGAAVGCGASLTCLERGPRGFSFHFDGEPFPEEQLRRLLPSLLSTDSPLAMRELATALMTLLSVKPQALTYESWHKGTGFQLHLHSEGELQHLSQCPWKAEQTGHRVTFKLSTSGKDVGSVMAELLTGDLRKSSLARRCALAPIPIMCDQNDLRSFPSDKILSYALWEHPDHPIDKEFLPTNLGLYESSPGPFSLLLALGPEPTLTCNVNGIGYQVPREIENNDLWCLITNNEAKRDLSYSSIQDSQEWSLIKGYLGIGSRKLVQFTEERHRLASEAQEKKAWSAALRRVPSTLVPSTGDSRAVYQTSDGRWMTLQQLRSQRRVLYTDRKWEYPLRSGLPVFILSADERRPFDSRAHLADEELASSQIYFQKHRLWKSQTPTYPFGPSKGSSPVHKLEKAPGQIGLQRDPLEIGMLYPYIGGRLLGVFAWPSLPNGSWLSLEHEDFHVGDTWTTVKAGSKALEVLQSIALSAQVHFYVEIFEKSPKYNLHLLNYLNYLKKQKRPWYQLLPKLAFKKSGIAGMFGGHTRVTLAEQYALHGPRASIVAFAEMVTGGQLAGLLPKLLQGLSLSRTEKSLLQNLCD